tara:strand:+ start:607 stop:1236 length:630 start_codon:yes stop_codon:yes gene_type:complete
MEDIKLIHGDSLQALKGYADNHFDIAIVDPPYGINVNMNMGVRKGEKRKHKSKDWDKQSPSKEYFIELLRVSKNQIIWGANNFIDNLTNKTGWIFWDKVITGDVQFSAGELAWTSFDCSLKKVAIPIQTNYLEEKRIHPTQKPIKLYSWLIDKYTNENDLILDTHLGSGGIAIAAHYMKRKLIGYEIDKEYYDAACKRFKEQTMQQALW